MRIARLLARLAFSVGLLVMSHESAHAQASGAAFAETLPPGSNYDKAEFKLWLPAGVTQVRAVAVLVPGSNGDGRGQVDDPVWQAFATSLRLALVGVRLTDKPHEQSFIEHYVNVSQGSGQALLDVLATFARTSQHPELAHAPLLLWGMSAGGEFNYEFANWKPERVLGFVVNKGGIYYTALASAAARRVPALLFVGGRDLDSRVQTITGLFALNRRGAALWALVNEPSAGHVVGRSREMALRFYEDLLDSRLPESTGDTSAPRVLRPLTEGDGIVGDPKTHETWKAGERTLPNYPTAWLPSERLAHMWRAIETDQPFAGEAAR